MKRRAFTLIELLVVIVVVGILSTITTATYRGYIERAENAKLTAELKQNVTDVLALRTSMESVGVNHEQLMNAELELIDKVISLARKKESKTLLEIIDDGGCSDCVCREETFNDMPTLAAQECIDTWDDLTVLFNTVTDINISFLQSDPWGSPYLIDQNEGEHSGNYCRQDNIFSAGPDLYHDVFSGTETVVGDGFQRSISFYDESQCVNP